MIVHGVRQQLVTRCGSNHVNHPIDDRARHGRNVHCHGTDGGISAFGERDTVESNELSVLRYADAVLHQLVQCADRDRYRTNTRCRILGLAVQSGTRDQAIATQPRARLRVCVRNQCIGSAES